MSTERNTLQAQIDALSSKFGISDVAAAFYVVPMYGERFRDAVDVFCGEGAGQWLIDMIASTPDEECQDSYRLAISGIGTDELFYQDQVSCCGSSDFTWKHEASGIEFRFGYNYGH